jgi:hypothetical protein
MSKHKPSRNPESDVNEEYAIAIIYSRTGTISVTYCGCCGYYVGREGELSSESISATEAALLFEFADWRDENEWRLVSKRRDEESEW